MTLVARVTERYDAAAHLEVQRHRVGWPVLAAAIASLRRLRRLMRDHGAPLDLEELLSEAWRWSGWLTGTPLDPAAPDTGTTTLLEDLSRFLETGRESRFSVDLERLRAAVAELAVERHPIRSVLEDVVSRYGRETLADPAAVYVAAQQQHAQAVQRWFDEQELDVEVRSVPDLRDAEVRDALVLLGPPARYIASPWCPLDVAEQRGAWLLTAPPARHVHVVLWSGQPKLGATSFLPRDGVLAPPVGAEALDVDGSDVEPMWVPPTPVRASVSVADWTMDRDPVKATVFVLAGERIALFSSEAGPKPHVVSAEVGSVETIPVPVASVVPGRALLFRPERSAVDAELRRRAEALLTSRKGPGATAAAYAAKAELKRAVAACGADTNALVRDLGRRLGDNYQYARHVITSLADDDYIAPERSGAYDALRHVLGLPDDADGSIYAALRGLRGALRRAGQEITAELVAALHDDMAWYGDLEDHGYAIVVVGEQFGELEIRVVAAVDPVVKLVGRSRLGRCLPLASVRMETL
jgi:hypothetical protein